MNEPATDDEKAFALWSLETTRRLVRNNLCPGPGFSTYDLVITADEPTEPDSLAEPDEEEDGPEDLMLEDMLSIVLSHHMFLALLAEYPDLESEIADLSYAEALRVVYHHQYDA